MRAEEEGFQVCFLLELFVLSSWLITYDDLQEMYMTCVISTFKILREREWIGIFLMSIMLLGAD